MFRYKLRTLLIVLGIGPPMLWWTYITSLNSAARGRRDQLREKLEHVADEYAKGDASFSTLTSAKVEFFAAEARAAGNAEDRQRAQQRKNELQKQLELMRQ